MKPLQLEYQTQTRKKKHRKMAPGLRQFTERRGDGAGEPVLDNDNGEELMYVQPGVSIVIGNRSPESQGTVYISTK